MVYYVETLSPTDIDETGFTAHGRNTRGSWSLCFDWATSPSLLPGIENEVEIEANHVLAGNHEDERDGWYYYSKRINCGQGIFYYRAVYYSNGA